MSLHAYILTSATDGKGSLDRTSEVIHESSSVAKNIIQFEEVMRQILETSGA